MNASKSLAETNFALAGFAAAIFAVNAVVGTAVARRLALSASTSGLHRRGLIRRAARGGLHRHLGAGLAGTGLAQTVFAIDIRVETTGAVDFAHLARTRRPDRRSVLRCEEYNRDGSHGDERKSINHTHGQISFVK